MSMAYSPHQDTYYVCATQGPSWVLSHLTMSWYYYFTVEKLGSEIVSE